MKPEMTRLGARLRAVAALLLTVAVMTGCEKDMFAFKPEFSVNIFYPGKKWPNMEKMMPNEQQVFNELGKPDAFRALWNPQGTLVGAMEIMDRLKEVQKGKNIPPYTWVYEKRQQEIVFSPSGYEAQPLNDQMMLVLKYGDPEDVKKQENGVEQWMFYSVGRLYKFQDGKIIETKEFPAMGAYPKM